MTTPNTDRIRELNDAFRRTGLGGVIMISAGLAALGSHVSTLALCATAKFDSFDPAADPYGEHHFRMIFVMGRRLFWKIDYYDLTLSSGAEDPTDETTCRRVLTLMLTEEY